MLPNCSADRPSRSHFGNCLSFLPSGFIWSLGNLCLPLRFRTSSILIGTFDACGTLFAPFGGEPLWRSDAGGQFALASLVSREASANCFWRSVPHILNLYMRRTKT